jgi:TPR repeat protein
VQDDGRACRYLRQAAEMGSPKGQYLYGELLFKGEGTESKVLEALEWLDKAAAQNYPRAVDIQAKFDAFVTFDPSRGLVGGVPVDHPFPLRQRTVVTMLCLAYPCYQAMARDLYDYVLQHPKDSEAALQDIATLMKAAAGKGEPLVTFIA